MIRLRRLFTFLMFVAFAALFSGCCMKRDIDAVDAQISRLRFEQKEMKSKIDTIDSLVNSESEAAVALRAEIKSSLKELLDQYAMIQSNMNDLQNKVDNMTTRAPAYQVIPPVVTSDSSADTTAAAPVIPGIDCQELYDESFINVPQGQYEEAIQGFTDYLTYCGKQSLADDARFWMGECYFFMAKYNEAISEFNLLMKNFPDSEKRAGALYKMARSYEELGRKKEARETFQKLVDEFDGTLEAEQAKEKLKELK